MKFGKQLEKSSLLKYRGYYIQYKELKKALKVYTGQDRNTATVQEVTHWSSSFLRLGPNPELTPEAKLHAALSKELERISTFTKLEEDAIRTLLQRLLQDCLREAHPDKEQAQLLYGRMDQVGESIAHLKSYCSLNFTGFRKILKKYDKWSQSTVLPWYMAQVARAPLMNVDFEGMLQTLGQVATTLREKASPLEMINEGMEDLSFAHRSDPFSGQELVFLLDSKDTMVARVLLVKYLVQMTQTLEPAQEDQPFSSADFLPPGTAGHSEAPRPERRPRLMSLFLDTPDLSVYMAHLGSTAGHPDAEVRPQEPPCTSIHLRHCSSSAAVCVTYETPSPPSRVQALLSTGDVQAFLQGKAPAAVLPANAPGSELVAGIGAFAEGEEANRAVKAAAQAIGEEGMRPLVQASFVRTLYTDPLHPGITLALDESIRFGMVEGDTLEDLESFVGLPEHVPLSVVTISFSPETVSICPRWLNHIYRCGNFNRVNGFSKGAHALAFFKAKELSLPIPAWHRTVLNSTASSEPSAEASETQSVVSGGLSGVLPTESGPESGVSPGLVVRPLSLPVIPDEAATGSKPLMSPAPVMRLPSRASSRLLHEFGTTPEEEEAAATRAVAVAVARGDQRMVPNAENGGSLRTPLLLASGPDPVREESEHRDEAPPYTGEDLPVRRAIVAVQPKTLYSNERTFLEWIHFATMIASLGVLLLHTSREPGDIHLGRILVVIAIFLVVWSMRTFTWRAEALDYKEARDYEDPIGPTALVAGLLVALGFSTLQAVGFISFE